MPAARIFAPSAYRRQDPGMGNDTHSIRIDFSASVITTIPMALSQAALDYKTFGHGD